MSFKLFNDKQDGNGVEPSAIDTSRDNTDKPFSQDYHVQGLRLWGHPEIVWPTFEAYQRDLPRLHQIWPDEELYLGCPYVSQKIETAEDFLDYREAHIRTLVELPCADLVRQIMDAGFYTTQSNAYASGAKGVYWAQSLDDVISGSEFYFTDLLSGKTTKHIFNKEHTVQETNYRFRGIGHKDLRAFEQECANNVIITHQPARNPMDAFFTINRVDALRGKWAKNSFHFISASVLGSDSPQRPKTMPHDKGEINPAPDVE